MRLIPPTQIWSALVGVVRTRGAGELVSITWLPFVVGEGRTRVQVEVRGFGVLRVGSFRRWVDGYFRETLLVPAGTQEVRLRFRTLRTGIVSSVTIPVHVRVEPPAAPASGLVVRGLQMDTRAVSSTVGGLSVHGTVDFTLRPHALPTLRARSVDLAARVVDLPAISVGQSKFMMARKAVHDPSGRDG
jgi:hypothetical protein